MRMNVFFPFPSWFQLEKIIFIRFYENLKGLFDLQGILFPEIGKEL